jgi:hypothetical protein
MTEPRKLDLDTVLKRVRQFTAKAEAEIAPGATAEQRAASLVEQQTAREMADRLMTDYAVDRAMADAARPADKRNKPGKLEFAVSGYTEISGYINRLATIVARHCRVQVRLFTNYNRDESCWMATGYGFESDLAYFNILYTTLRLHMVGALVPKVDPTLDLDENCYVLHNAGLNWLEIAALYGWKKTSSEPGDTQPLMYINKDGERKSNWTVGSHYKRAYGRACKAKGEATMVIAASSTATYRESAAQGYISRITQRLARTEAARDPGAGVALRTSFEEVLAYFKSQNPDLYKEQAPVEECEQCKKNPSGTCRRHPRGRMLKDRAFSAAGYQAGVKHANAASLSPEASTSQTGQIG